jgi:hypothetical protein
MKKQREKDLTRKQMVTKEKLRKKQKGFTKVYRNIWLLWKMQ